MRLKIGPSGEDPSNLANNFLISIYKKDKKRRRRENYKFLQRRMEQLRYIL